MKIRIIALATFGSLVRRKTIVLFCAIFLCLLLLMMLPIAGMKTSGMGESYILTFIATIMSMTSGFGSLLAAWSASDAVAEEIKSGTILAVMARPVRRWEFLLGKYLGGQLLMLIYVGLMIALSFGLAAIGGQRIEAPLWILVVYPMIRYAIYSALALLLVTRMHPVLAFTGVLVTAVGISMLAPGHEFLPEAIRMPIYAVLPSMGLLSEASYLGMTQSALKPIPWTNHLTAIVYGLDYAVVMFLLSAWSFRRRALTHD